MPVLLGLKKKTPDLVEYNIDARVTHQYDSISVVGTYWGTADPLYVLGNVENMTTVLRWASLGIPQGAQIVSATITLYSQYDYPATALSTAVSLIQADNPPRITSMAQHRALESNRGSSIEWGPMPALTMNQAWVSPDLSSIVQTVVNRPGFGPTSALQFMLEALPGAPGDRGFRSFYDGTSATYPRLQITYLA